MQEEATILQEYDVIGYPRVSIKIYEDKERRRFYNVMEPQPGELSTWAYKEILKQVTYDLDLSKSISSKKSLEEGIGVVVPIAKKLILKRLRTRLFFRRNGKAKYDEKKVEEEALIAAYYVSRDLVGYGKFEPLMKDPYIEDISCNGLHIPVFVYHTKYEWLTTNVVINDEEELNSIVSKLGVKSSREASIANPIVEGVLRPEGFRVNLVLDTVSRLGHSFTIRKFRAEPFTLIELIRSRTLDPLVASLLWLAVENKQGIIIYGPTGSGKTTLLNAITMLLPTEYKIVTAEDTPEIYLPFHENWGAMMTRTSTDPKVQNVTLQSQVEAALRQRPDVIIVGEIRSREAFAFFQALATGHGGLTTIHAESADVLIKRLVSPPMNVPASLIAASRLFVNILRIEEGGNVYRKVMRIDESWGYDITTNSVILKEKVLWDRKRDLWYMIGKDSYLLRSVAQLNLITYEEVFVDLERRATVLKWLADINADSILLNEALRLYRRDPVGLYKKAVSTSGKYNIEMREAP
ncbi:MAG: type II/IV secretion system ATPase subunit [Caldisphaeraceae archaeon]|nr:type II/IV secretion system ATPase subunit [Caldisphaeraceae archaeon]MEB3692346.1 type II/IV secretion system ATPase subunit [Caldisphaeraceae archaeon]